MKTVTVDLEYHQDVDILFKPSEKIDINEFKDLLDAAQQWAAEVGMTEEDIQEAIATVRSGKAVCK
jgi:hypothetical protein